MTTTRTVTTALFCMILLAVSVSAAVVISTPAEVTITFQQATATKQFTISNSGDQEATTIKLVRSSNFELEFSEDGSSFSPSLTLATLAAGSSKSITARATVPAGKLSTAPIGTATITSDQNTTNSITFKADIPSKLKFKNVQLDATKKNKNIAENDTIRNIKGGDRVEITVELENTFTTEENIDIDDITVEVTIKDIDDGDDLEEDAEISTIDAGDDDKVTLDFQIPDESDEDEYKVLIKAFGTDDNNFRHEIRFEFKIEVDKENHDVRVYKASLTSPVVRCDRTTVVETTIKNFGRSDEDDAAVKITARELGVEVSKFDLDLDNNAFNDKSEYEYSTTITLENEFPPGSYPISITAYRNNEREEDQKIVTLTVEPCTFQPSTQRVQQTQQVQVPTVLVNNPVLKQEESKDVPTLAIILLVILIGLLIFIGKLIHFILMRSRRY